MLFVGRFQPFHKGHFGTLKKIAQVEDIGEIIIGIGSSDQSFTSNNPFTAEEREEMIRSSLDLSNDSVSPQRRRSIPINLPLKIVYIPDNLSDDEWVNDVLKKFDGDLVYSGNDWVARLLTKAGLEVRTPPPIENPSGTDIRQMMKEGKSWQQFVPEEVSKVITKIKGELRVKQIS